MKLGYVILYVPDVKESVAFYEAAFDLRCRFVHGGGDYAELETGSTVLAFASENLADSHHLDYRKTRHDEAAPSIEIALVADDVRGAFAMALTAGATSAKEPTEQPWGQLVSYVRDNNGYLVEICSPITPPAS